MTGSSRRPMRVLQFFSRDGVGGVQVLAGMIGSGLSRRGFEVDEMALVAEGGIGRRLVHLGRVAGRLLFGRYDAILAYQPAASIAMGTLGRLGGVRIRVSHLTSMPDAIRPHWRVADSLVGRCGGYTTVIANSSTTAHAFSRYPDAYRRSMRPIPHGVALLRPSSTTVDWRGRLGIPADATVLVATGRLTGQKDHATAIRALALLPQAHLAIAGDGPERAAMLALARDLGVADRLHLAGSIAREELTGFLALGRVYLFPSVWETFGIAGVEAQMAGLPVVAADLPVLREVLMQAGDERVLRFHPVGDEAALARQVEATIAQDPDPELLRSVAEAATRCHSIDTMVGRYLDLLRQ